MFRPRLTDIVSMTVKLDDDEHRNVIALVTSFDEARCPIGYIVSEAPRAVRALPES